MGSTERDFDRVACTRSAAIECESLGIPLYCGRQWVRSRTDGLLFPYEVFLLGSKSHLDPMNFLFGHAPRQIGSEPEPEDAKVQPTFASCPRSTVKPNSTSASCSRSRGPPTSAYRWTAAAFARRRSCSMIKEPRQVQTSAGPVTTRYSFRHHPELLRLSESPRVESEYVAAETVIGWPGVTTIPRTPRVR
jgi:hypothetical protein